MKIVFEIFTGIGAFLGIISFFLNIFSSFTNHNKLKWEELRKIIEVDELILYAQYVDGGFLPKELEYKLRNLIYQISLNTDNMQFKGIAGKKAYKSINEVYKVYYQMIKKIQTPYWTIIENGRTIDKEYFLLNIDDNKEAYKKIDENREFVSEKVKEIHSLYSAVRNELTKTPIEHLKFW